MRKKAMGSCYRCCGMIKNFVRLGEKDPKTGKIQYGMLHNRTRKRKKTLLILDHSIKVEETILGYFSVLKCETIISHK